MWKGELAFARVVIKLSKSLVALTTEKHASRAERSLVAMLLGMTILIG